MDSAGSTADSTRPALPSTSTTHASSSSSSGHGEQPRHQNGNGRHDDRRPQNGTNHANGGRAGNAASDDEEEEGMLHVTEEGQIEEEVSRDPVSNGSLAGRLQPLPDKGPTEPPPPSHRRLTSDKSKGGPRARAGVSRHGSPRAPVVPYPDRGDRFYEASPAPSTYSASRQRFSYAGESASVSSPTSAIPPYSPGAYAYGAPHRDRDPTRSDSYAPPTRSSFGGSVSSSRAEPLPSRRGGGGPAGVGGGGGYASPAAAARAPDTYRPGAAAAAASAAAIRDRDRDWDWERERDRDWSVERERDAYRYRELEREREWERERSRAAMLSSSAAAYDPLIEPVAGHPAYAAASKYGPDRLDYPPHALAPPGRERDRDYDRDWDYERDWDRDRDRERDSLRERERDRERDRDRDRERDVQRDRLPPRDQRTWGAVNAQPPASTGWRQWGSKSSDSGRGDQKERRPGDNDAASLDAGRAASAKSRSSPSSRGNDADSRAPASNASGPRSDKGDDRASSPSAIKSPPQTASTKPAPTAPSVPTATSGEQDQDRRAPSPANSHRSAKDLDAGSGPRSSPPQVKEPRLATAEVKAENVAEQPASEGSQKASNEPLSSIAQDGNDKREQALAHLADSSLAAQPSASETEPANSSTSIAEDVASDKLAQSKPESSTASASTEDEQKSTESADAGEGDAAVTALANVGATEDVTMAEVTTDEPQSLAPDSKATEQHLEGAQSPKPTADAVDSFANEEDLETKEQGSSLPPSRELEKPGAEERRSTDAKSQAAEPASIGLDAIDVVRRDSPGSRAVEQQVPAPQDASADNEVMASDGVRDEADKKAAAQGGNDALQSANVGEGTVASRDAAPAPLVAVEVSLPPSAPVEPKSDADGDADAAVVKDGELTGMEDVKAPEARDKPRQDGDAPAPEAPREPMPSSSHVALPHSSSIAEVTDLPSIERYTQEEVAEAKALAAKREAGPDAKEQAHDDTDKEVRDPVPLPTEIKSVESPPKEVSAAAPAEAAPEGPEPSAVEAVRNSDGTSAVVRNQEAATGASASAAPVPSAPDIKQEAGAVADVEMAPAEPLPAIERQASPERAAMDEDTAVPPASGPPAAAELTVAPSKPDGPTEDTLPAAKAKDERGGEIDSTSAGTQAGSTAEPTLPPRPALAETRKDQETASPEEGGGIDVAGRERPKTKADKAMRVPHPEDAGLIPVNPALELRAEVEQAEAVESVQKAARGRLPALQLRGLHDGSAVELEAPLFTPRTEEERQKASRRLALQILSEQRISERDCRVVIRENQELSRKTTLDQLHAAVHGVPLSVSEGKPLWRDEDDKSFARTHAKLMDQLLAKRRRLNAKVDRLKQQYRTINEEWQVHCARLDRIIERRELQRRPLVSTPQTPAGVAPDDAGSGMLSNNVMMSRTNRRGQQAGFAGFGDAVRSEAEFLEILASLENADMQDPSMRAARTTATVPDMELDPDSDQPVKLDYDDSNGFVADPVGFYLSDFDPDVWSEEEKAIFARRYALWPKQFGKIAQALPHKTPGQCVVYYYLNKKAPGNDFKALAAARNRERKRKTRVKPKKAKGSALMADLKSAKGDELDDDDAGPPSPTEPGESAKADVAAPATANPSRRGGTRPKMTAAPIDGGQGAGGDDGAAAAGTSAGKKRSATDDAVDADQQETRPSDKKKSGSKAKRAKTEAGGEKVKRGKATVKRESTAETPSAVAGTKVAGPATGPDVSSGEAHAAIPGPKHQQSPAQASDTTDVASAAPAAPPVGPQHADSDLAAAEALGALAGLFSSAPATSAATTATAAPAPTPVSESATRADSTAEAGPDVSMSNDSDLQKAPKKRRGGAAGKNGVVELGEGGEPVAVKVKTRQPTSSYWSVAERSEFLRSLALHGKNWDAIASALSQKSAAQARNYFARNAAEPDFTEAAMLAEQNAGLSLDERMDAASAFARQRFSGSSAHVSANAAAAAAAAAASTIARGPSPMGSSGLPTPVTAPEVNRSSYFATVTALPRATSAAPMGQPAAPRVVSGGSIAPDSPPPSGYRGLQINSLLNEESLTDHDRKRRSSIHDWFGDRGDGEGAAINASSGGPAERSVHGDGLDRIGTASRSVAADVERRPLTSDGPQSRYVPAGELAATAKRYEAFGVQRQPSSSATSYAGMPPPSAFQVERAPSVYPSRHSASQPPPTAQAQQHQQHQQHQQQHQHQQQQQQQHPPSHLHRPSPPTLPPPSGALEAFPPAPAQPAPPSRYSTQPEYRTSEPSLAHRSAPPLSPREASEHTLPPVHAGPARPTGLAYERASSAAPSHPALPPYGRYSASPGPSAIYASHAPSSLAMRGRTLPGAAYAQPSGSTTDRSPEDLHRSMTKPYSTYSSQGPAARPSLSPSTAGGVPLPPTLPSLSAGGRSLPPLLGTFGSRAMPPSLSRPTRPMTPDEQRWHHHQQQQQQREQER
ncbi:uncharacterized protein PFL1_01108 [Pseudozyma flocculosa PF-1]|uniref:uncharacterized protein n=1 Tax=Pseudozyma flocculosa PF-1 TaxID=1277687 RepID=UPI0004560BD1|nr:uncharacterized protein PFL1_01108 [Pseudozyma flocculosa PF-1]EPQ31776.1 hypothetical protein PFL1_01108 [Pseudozyma flocculosa PF-1]